MERVVMYVRRKGNEIDFEPGDRERHVQVETLKRVERSSGTVGKYNVIHVPPPSS
jgi:hypothetical protein